jgi:hypothetical protein
VLLPALLADRKLLVADAAKICWRGTRFKESGRLPTSL